MEKSDFIKQSIIADMQWKIFLKLIEKFKRNKKITVTMCHDSIIITKNN
jgi:putative intracellular protease/amidase